MYYGVQWWKKGSNAKWKPTGWVPEAASFPKNYDLCRPFFVFEIGNCFLRSTISGHFHGFQCFLAFPPRGLWLEQAIFLRERERLQRDGQLGLSRHPVWAFTTWFSTRFLKSIISNYWCVCKKNCSRYFRIKSEKTS